MEMETGTSGCCDLVRSTCRRWIEEGQCVHNQGKQTVSVHLEKIPELAKDILQKRKANPDFIEWDEENWHYSGSSYTGSDAQRKERVALYILSLDAINFCFWPSPSLGEKEREGARSEINSLEYDHLAIALKKMAEVDDKEITPENEESNNTSVVKCNPSYAFSPQNLAEMTPAKMASYLEPHLQGHYLDNIDKRSQLWKEIGTVLLSDFDGSATQMLARAQNDATKLVDLVFNSFPGFQDFEEINSEPIFFLKRAQIFVGDVNAALKLNLHGMERLTTFADYRVPQILRHFGILVYDSELAEKVDSLSEFPKGSPHELSIRASTVVAVEELVKFLNKEAESKDEPFTDVLVDWYLWQVGEKMNQSGELKPFHKVRTHFY